MIPVPLVMETDTSVVWSTAEMNAFGKLTVTGGIMVGVGVMVGVTV